MQRELIGRGKIASLVEELSRLAIKRILLVTCKESYRSSGAEQALDEMLAGYPVTTFNGFTPNPKFQDAITGADLYRSENCDAIVAVGGGSAMDIAKSINVFQAHSGDEWALATGTQLVSNSLSPLIAIPTTAGTGSEATHFAVIYVDGKKYSLAAPELLPDVAIVDAALTDTLPPYISACTGLDALSQSIESYWAVAATEESRSYAERAIVLLINNQLNAVLGIDQGARDAVIVAANLAGKAINISKTTAPHALSYTITSAFGIPHGHAVAMTLGQFFVLHENIDERSLNGKQSMAGFHASMENLLRLLGANSGEDAKRRWYELMRQCGLTTGLVDNGIGSDADIEAIVDGVNCERLGNHPVKLTRDMMRRVVTEL
jgi:alcohol dehydrogenase class IV